MNAAIRLIVVTVIVVLRSVAFEQHNGQATPNTIRVTGRVVDAAGYPLPHATVKLGVPGSDKPTAELVTDANGVFMFRSVSQERQWLRVDEPGFVSRTVELAMVEKANQDVDVGAVVLKIGPVTEGEVTPSTNQPDNSRTISEPGNVSEMGCIERLEIPRYPPLATAAWIDGTIKASVHLTQGGKVERVDTEGESKFSQAKSLLSAPVWSVIREAKFRPDCAGKTIRLVFHFDLRSSTPGDPKASVSFGYPNRFWIVSEAPHWQPEQQSDTASDRSTTSTGTLQFSKFPAPAPYNGPVAKPKFSQKFDERYRAAIQDGLKGGLNFAGHYALVRFRIGDGPIGAAVVDIRSGSIFYLPPQVVREELFIYDTDCLALHSKWRTSASEENDDASALSFLPQSELLVVRRCLGAGRQVIGVEKSYFRWHGNRWSLLQRVVLPPPPPLPIPQASFEGGKHGGTSHRVTLLDASNRGRTAIRSELCSPS